MSVGVPGPLPTLGTVEGRLWLLDVGDYDDAVGYVRTFNFSVDPTPRLAALRSLDAAAITI